MLFGSCNDYLDINENVNKPTEVDASLVLPQALTATASVLNRYNTYGMQIGGFAANAGGYGGFNELVTYKYTPNNYADLWPYTYDNLEDYQYIITKTADIPEEGYAWAMAKIMRVYDFQLLVDAFNNVPYSTALLGDQGLTPTYDDAATVYAALGTELDEAIAKIHATDAVTGATTYDASDVVFEGDMTKWLQLANTIKLRLLVRASGKAPFANETFDEAGFLDEDALINPGYTRDNNRQNPKWNSWGFQYTGNSGAKSWMPTKWAMSFYDGDKLDDSYRGSHMYYKFPDTGTNQLGYESTDIEKSPEGSFWYPSTNRDGKSSGESTGALKGPDAGFPLLTAAESYFLQAEWDVRHADLGGAKTAFETGILKSFDYVYQLPDGTHEDDFEEDFVSYMEQNSDSRLVNFDMATNDEQRVEAIITQKYIALNMVNSQEAWNEYRRTGYPKVSGTSGTSTFASLKSAVGTGDKLPTRILYPQSEIQYNPENVPAVDSGTDKIFWAK